MNNIKLKKLIKNVILEVAPELGQFAGSSQGRSTGRSCYWDLNTNGIKVFFDITRPFDYKDGGQTAAGTAIALTAVLTNKQLTTVNHVGFVLKNGSIIDAVAGSGVTMRNGDEIKNNPHNYVIVDVGGDESTLLKKYTDLKKSIEKVQGKNEKEIDSMIFGKTKASYDVAGVYRQIPVIGGLLKHLNSTREKNKYSFYCSELVAHLLVLCGVLKVNDLMKENLSEDDDALTDLDKYDEVNPTKLYNLIKDISQVKVLRKICKNTSQQTTEHTISKQELKQIVREAIVEVIKEKQ
jgi:hypothetical protein